MRNIEIIKNVGYFFEKYWDQELSFAIIADYYDARDFINEGIRLCCDLVDCSEFSEEDSGPYIVCIDGCTIWVQHAMTDSEKYVGDKTFVYCEADYYFIDAEYAYDYIEDYPHVEDAVFPIIVGEPKSSGVHIDHDFTICPDDDYRGFCLCFSDEDGNHHFKYRGNDVLTGADMERIINTQFLNW